MPHSIIHGDAYFAYFNKIWGIPRRAYRWLYSGLHTLNFAILMAHPLLRTVLIVGLCSCGFVFSVTGTVIAQSRLRSLW